MAMAAAIPVRAAPQLEPANCATRQDARPACIPALIKATGEAFDKGDAKTVEQLARRIIALAEGASPSPSLELGQAYNLLGTAIEAREGPAAGVPYYLRAIAIYDALPEVVDDKRIALYNMGWAQVKAGAFAEAEPAFRRALQIAQARSERAGEYSARAGLGTVFYRTGRNSEADDEYRRALGIAIELWGDEAVETARAYRSVALNLGAQSRYGEAELLLRKALGVFRTKDGEKHRRTALVHADLGGMLLAQGKFAEAADCYRKALTIQTELLGAGHAETVGIAFQLGQVHWEMGDQSGGLKMMRSALAAMAKAPGADDLALAGQQKLFAMFLHRRGAHAEDERLRRESLATYTRRLSPTDGSLIAAMAEFGTVLLFHEKPAEALAYHRLAIERLTRRLADSSRDSVLLNERNRKRTYYRTLITTLWLVGP
jgi:tetratricopeptide (TPR) repeat protein